MSRLKFLRENYKAINIYVRKFSRFKFTKIKLHYIARKSINATCLSQHQFKKYMNAYETF